MRSRESPGSVFPRGRPDLEPDPVIARNPIGQIVETDYGPDGLATATFDVDRQYRYRMSRVWDRDLPRIVWCMLNPSRATASVGDPTLRRVVRFSRSWGGGGCEVVNLFALRTFNPRDLRTTRSDPVGQYNDEAIAAAVGETGEVVAAWGNNGVIVNRHTGVARCDEVQEFLGRLGIRLLHLQLTNQGRPVHPLYVRGDTEPRQLVIPHKWSVGESAGR
jgi:hypothetical protein